MNDQKTHDLKRGLFILIITTILIILAHTSFSNLITTTGPIGFGSWTILPEMERTVWSDINYLIVILLASLYLVVYYRRSETPIRWTLAIAFGILLAIIGLFTNPLIVGFAVGLWALIYYINSCQSPPETGWIDFNQVKHVRTQILLTATIMLIFTWLVRGPLDSLVIFSPSMLVYLLTICGKDE